MVPGELRKEFDPRSLWKEISKEAATWNFLSSSDLLCSHWQYYLKWKQFPDSPPNFGKGWYYKSRKILLSLAQEIWSFTAFHPTQKSFKKSFFPVHWLMCTEQVLRFYICFSFLVLRSYEQDFKEVLDFFFLRFGIWVILRFWDFFRFYF